MDHAERARRRNEIGNQIRDLQQRKGHEGPLPAFLDILTDFMIDTNDRLERIERQMASIDGRMRPMA